MRRVHAKAAMLPAAMFGCPITAEGAGADQALVCSAFKKLAPAFAGLGAREQSLVVTIAFERCAELPRIFV